LFSTGQIGREEPFLILTYIVRDEDQREPGDAEIKENGSRVVKTNETKERTEKWIDGGKEELGSEKRRAWLKNYQLRSTKNASKDIRKKIKSGRE